MLTTFWLMSCVMGLSQTGDQAEWQLAPRLSRGQELVYRGTVREENIGGGVQFQRNYSLEARAFVLHAKNDGANVAFFTRLTLHRHPPAEKPEAETSSVRLDLADLEALGRLTAANGSTSLPPDGPATWECGFLIEVPRDMVKAQQTWLVSEAGKPPRKFRVDGIEVVDQTTCVKVVAEQQSEDWDKPRGDSTAWRRKDTVWLVPRQGYAYKVERELERREPAHREATCRIVTSYKLDSSLVFNNNLFFEDRKREITQIREFQEKVLSLLPEARNHGPKPFEAIIARIDQHTQNAAKTPYRDALLRVRQLAVMGSKNEVPPRVPELEPKSRLVIGKPAPEFVVGDLATKENVTPRKWRGKSVLMVFFQPNSSLNPDVLRYVQQLADQNADLVVVGLAMSDDAAAVDRLKRKLVLTMPVLAGSSLRTSYDVEATPRFVVLDEEGLVRAAYVSWGPEIRANLNATVKKCLSRKSEKQPSVP